MGLKAAARVPYGRLCGGRLAHLVKDRLTYIRGGSGVCWWGGWAPRWGVSLSALSRAVLRSSLGGVAEVHIKIDGIYK